MSNEQRPVALAVMADSIPEQLRAERRWVCWRYEFRDGRWTKVPYSRPGRRASSTDSATWIAFDEALAAYLQGLCDGIGFVLGDGWCGFDSDRSRDPQTAGVDAATLAILDRLDTYAEVSVSGTGVHALARYGREPLRGRRSGQFEFYCSGRFFVVTGHSLPGSPLTVNDRTAEFTAVYTELFGAPVRQDGSGMPADLLTHAGCGTELITAADVVRPISDLTDDELLERMFAASNGPQIRSLFQGDKSTYGGDDSSADMALATHLAFWTQRDSARMDRIFRRSGLYRGKWDARRGSATYGQRTIERAIDRSTEVYQPARDLPAATLPGPASSLTAADLDAPYRGDF